MFKKSDDINKLKSNIEKQLENSEFIESLINTITVKTRYRKYIDVGKIITLLLELEKLRLALEYEN